MEPIAVLAEKSKQAEQTEQLALQVPECTEAAFLLLPCILWPTHLLQLRHFCSFGTYKSSARVDAPTLVQRSIDTVLLQLSVPPHGWAKSPMLPPKPWSPHHWAAGTAFHLRWGRERHFPKDLNRPMWAPQSELTLDFKWKSCWRLAQIPWPAACQVLGDYFYHYLFIKINCLGAGPQTDRI